jgi:hypothetical protein
MLIRRKVHVKAIVTEQFKQDLLGRLREARLQVELSQQQLEYQGRKYLSDLESKDPAQAEAFRRKIERQKQKREELKTKLVAELAAAESLELGTEYQQVAIEGLAEVNVGDNLSEKLQAAEVVIKDGIVVDIRHD